MQHKLIRLMRFAAVALVLGVFGACADGAGVQLLGPSDGPAESLSLADDIEAIVNGLKPDLSVRTHEKVIGPEGGSLYVDLHYLYVPRGAVSEPTKFRIELRDDHKIGVSLTATSSTRSGVTTGADNNVGSRGFNKAVYLTFSYQFATDKPDNPYSIKVVEIRDGLLIPQPTYINPFFQTATGTLKHFSDYGIAWPTRTRG